VKWGDLPTTAKVIGQERRRSRYGEFADELRNNVGRWAQLPTAAQTEVGAESTARKIWRGRLVDFAAGRFETAVDGTDVWVRCVDAKAKPRDEGPGVIVVPIPDGMPTEKDIRTWAYANDIPVPSRGRVPNEVRNAYALAAQERKAG
jgi:hypothetical protein